MTFSVQYAEEFETDLQEIIDWYGDQGIGLDRKFVENLKIATEQLAANPLIYRSRTKGARFKHVDRFPYIIVFKVVKYSITIFGVIHDRRNPKLIRKRIK